MGLTQSKQRQQQQQQQQQRVFSSPVAGLRKRSRGEEIQATPSELDRKIQSEPDKRSPRCPERLMTTDCEMVQLGNKELFVQHQAAISDTLAKQVSKRSFLLSVALWSDEKQSLLPTNVRAQAGFIRIGPQAHGGLVWPVTAKHNFFDVDAYGTVFSYVPAIEFPKRFDFVSPMVHLLEFPEVETPPDFKQRGDCRGWDVQWGSKPVDQSNPAFQMVHPSFQPAVGMKIGICAVHEHPITLDDLETKFNTKETTERVGNLSRQDFERIFGPTLKPNIYTGEVIAVEAGEKLIVHNANSFGGCSGAIVFLLDQEQPDSVRREDYGKAIAIHCGSKEAGNYACLLSGGDFPTVDNLDDFEEHRGDPAESNWWAKIVSKAWKRRASKKTRDAIRQIHKKDSDNTTTEEMSELNGVQNIRK